LSKIFELYGYRLGKWNDEAEHNMRRAWCPFMDAECDGGGNRYQSAIDIKKNPALQSRIPGKDAVQCGVCSIQLHDGEQPWIVCPRRLLALKTKYSSPHQANVREELSIKAGLCEGRAYSVWAEVKVKTQETTNDDETKYFDYTFDYIISGTESKRVEDISAILNLSEKTVVSMAQKNHYALAFREDGLWVEDFPLGPPLIIEVMTSSTSGGNKKNRTQISMACEDAILNQQEHNAPGINYRQVWARMVSQLIVKSQVGIAWGGKTIWLVQDVLADYISKSTALVLSDYISERTDEVNILSFGYGDGIESSLDSIMELKESKLFAGPISKSGSANVTDGFVDIVKISIPPPKEQIWRSLLNKAPICGWKR